MSARTETLALTITRHANGVSVAPPNGPCTAFDPKGVFVFNDPKAMAEYIMATLGFHSAEQAEGARP